MRGLVRKGDNWRSEERRKEPRYKLILRVGVVEQAGKSALCLVKNVSTEGVQIKCYVQPVLNAEASIRVGDEPVVHGRVVWIKDDIAGINFHDELDAAALLRVQQKLRPKRRRMTPRVRIETVAILRSGGRTCRAVVSDISSLGTRIRSRFSLSVGDRAVITFADLPSINAFVRWRDGEESGLAFETPIPIQIIANWIEGRIRVSG